MRFTTPVLVAGRRWCMPAPRWAQLRHDPASVSCRRLPEAAGVYEHIGWQFPVSIDRVYCLEKAQRLLGYAPQYTARHLLREVVRKTGSATN